MLNAEELPRLQAADCWFEPGFGRQAECFYLLPSDHKSSRVRMPVVRFANQEQKKSNQAVIYLAGGPGAPAGLDGQGIGNWWSWLDAARWPGDLIVYDMRGAGLAEPSLSCPEIVATDRRGLDQPLGPDADLKRLGIAATQCRRRLEARGISFDDYLPQRHLADLDDLMDQLGYPQYDLWGSSYGTRLAMQAVRGGDTRIRSLVLDSVYPPEINGTLALPDQLQRARENIVTHCIKQQRCREAHGQVAEDMDRLSNKLDKNPQTLTVKRWPSEISYDVAINGYKLMWMLFFEGYYSPSHSRTAGAVDKAEGGDTQALKPMVRGLLDVILDERFSYGLYLTITCAENSPGLTEEAWQQARKSQPSVAQYLPSSLRYDLCAAWPAQALSQDYRQPVASGLPTLFLAGEYDSATLPEWAETAAARFPQGIFYKFKGSAHAVSWQNHCAIALAGNFLADPTDYAPPACVEKQAMTTP